MKKKKSCRGKHRKNLTAGDFLGLRATPEGVESKRKPWRGEGVWKGGSKTQKSLAKLSELAEMERARRYASQQGRRLRVGRKKK